MDAAVAVAVADVEVVEVAEVEVEIVVGEAVVPPRVFVLGPVETYLPHACVERLADVSSAHSIRVVDGDVGVSDPEDGATDDDDAADDDDDDDAGDGYRANRM